MSQSLRVGVIGAGFMGAVHARGVVDIVRRGLAPGTELTALAGLNHERGRKLAEELGCQYVQGGEALIDDDDVDVVVIASPTDTHLPLVRRCVRRGKPLFLEKPVARNLSEARLIAREILKAELPHQLGLILRFAPTYVVLRDLLSEPANGEFLVCRFRDDQFFPVNDIYDSNWRENAVVSGGGTLIEHSIHDLDAMRWLFGEPRMTDALVTASHAPGVEKLACLQFRFSGGGVGQLTSVWHSNMGRENEREIEIFCERRSFRTAGGYISPIVVQGPGGEPRTISEDEIKKRFLKLIGWKEHKNRDFPLTAAYELYVFLRSLREPGPHASAVDIGQGVAVHGIVDGAYRMANTQRRQP